MTEIRSIKSDSTIDVVCGDDVAVMLHAAADHIKSVRQEHVFHGMNLRYDVEGIEIILFFENALT